VSGTVDIVGNWFAGWNTAIILGSKNDPTVGGDNYATFNVSGNKYERDFDGALMSTGGGFSGTGGLNWDKTTEIWADTGETVEAALAGSIKKWTRAVCEGEGNCPAGTWDPDLEPWYWCCYTVC